VTYDAFLQKLKAAREEAGMTQREVSEKLGLSHTFLNKCETGERRVDVIELIQLAELYGKPALSQNRIARVLFYIDAKGRMVLLHGFIKKTQKTPPADLELARKNKALHENELKKGK
jgi:transcriptional regulator with XRE-family HTH domain